MVKLTLNMLRLFQVTWKVMQSFSRTMCFIFFVWMFGKHDDNAETWTPTETKSVKLQKILHWVSFLACKTIMWCNIYLRNSISMWRDCGWSKFKVSILLSHAILTLDRQKNLQLAFESIFFRIELLSCWKKHCLCIVTALLCNWFKHYDL